MAAFNGADRQLANVLKNIKKYLNIDNGIGVELSDSYLFFIYFK
jgi:hypothetical protein